MYLHEIIEINRKLCECCTQQNPFYCSILLVKGGYDKQKKKFVVLFTMLWTSPNSFKAANGSERRIEFYVSVVCDKGKTK